MLISFSVANYKSFKEKNTLLMLKSKERVHEEHIISKVAGFDLLKGAIIYGANASGKSNFIDAFSFAISFILNGKKDKESINTPQFLLDDDIKNDRTSFEFEFVLNNKAYSYGFVVSYKEVVEEWLCEINKKNNIEDKFIYSRENGIIQIGDYYSDKEKLELLSRIDFVKNNELFLTKSIDLNTEILREYIDWFKSVKIIKPNSRPLTIVPNLADSSFKEFLSHLLKVCDTGIERVEIKQEDIKILDLPQEILVDISNSLNENEGAIISASSITEHAVITKVNNELKAQVLRFIHKDKSNKDVRFLLSQESDGTKRLVDLSVALFSNDLNLLIIDELDRSLHPALTQFLCKNFIKNKQNKQLIITTHETSLLNKDWIRRDEIWFVNKEKNSGVSKLKPLSDYNQRYDKELRKAYLDGRFHGVPLFGDEEW